MPITIEPNKLTPFADLEQRSTFRWDGLYFIKIQEVEPKMGYYVSEPFNSVSLFTGELYSFNGEDFVDPVDINMTVSPAK